MYSIREICAAETASAWRREAGELSLKLGGRIFFFCCGLIFMALFGACMALGFVFFAFVRGGGCMSLFRIGVAARVWLHGALFFAFGRGGGCMALLRLGFGCMALVVFVLALIKSNAWSTPPFAAFAI